MFSDAKMNLTILTSDLKAESFISLIFKIKNIFSKSRKILRNRQKNFKALRQDKVLEMLFDISLEFHET